MARGPVRVLYSYEPMREIGGDFLFVRPLSFPPSAPAGPVLAVLIDVTGHGIAAALAVNRLHDELGRLCVGGRIAEPREVILALNAFITGALAPTGMFATAIALRVEPGEHASVRWAGADHPPAFLRHADGRVEQLNSTAPMLGVLDHDLFECQEGRADLTPGATVIAYTDGVNEAKDARGDLLGLPAIEALIAHGPADGASLAETLAAAVEAHRADQPTDDTLIVELTPQADGAESSPPRMGRRNSPPAVHSAHPNRDAYHMPAFLRPADARSLSRCSASRSCLASRLSIAALRKECLAMLQHLEHRPILATGVLHSLRRNQ